MCPLILPASAAGLALTSLFYTKKDHALAWSMVALSFIITFVFVVEF